MSQVCAKKPVIWNMTITPHDLHWWEAGILSQRWVYHLGNPIHQICIFIIRSTPASFRFSHLLFFWTFTPLILYPSFSHWAILLGPKSHFFYSSLASIFVPPDWLGLSLNWSFWEVCTYYVRFMLNIMLRLENLESKQYHAKAKPAYWKYFLTL